jgi:hypothetical protein
MEPAQRAERRAVSREMVRVVCLEAAAEARGVGGGEGVWERVEDEREREDG